MDNELTKRLMWSGLLAALGALASVATAHQLRNLFRSPQT